VSLPPCRLSGPGLVVGRGLGDEMDFNDSISLCEVRRGAFNKQPCENQFLLRRLFLLKLFVEEDLENEEEDQNYLDHLNNLNNLFWVFLSSCNWLKW
jgi:hypothetical protein